MITTKSSKDQILELVHPCKCDRCSHSCNFGSGTLVEDDLEQLAKHLGKSTQEVKQQYLEKVERFGTVRYRPKLLRHQNKPFGKCIFYNEARGCTVHPAKPLECKIAMGCKEYGEDLITWFDMRYFVDQQNKQSLRALKIHVESGGNTIPGMEEKIKDLDIDDYSDLEIKEDWEKKLGIKK